MEGNLTIRSAVIDNMEPIFSADGERDFTIPQLRKFAEDVFTFIAKVPANKVHLDSIGKLDAQTAPADAGLEQHTEPNCGSSFCVVGWTITQPKLAEQLGIRAEIDGFDLDMVNVRTGEYVDFDEAFLVNGERSNADSLMFGPSDISNHGVPDEEKLEALMRLACVAVAFEDGRIPEDENPLLNPDLAPETTYALLNHYGVLTDAVTWIHQRTGIDVSFLGAWVTYKQSAFKSIAADYTDECRLTNNDPSYMVTFDDDEDECDDEC